MSPRALRNCAHFVFILLDEAFNQLIIINTEAWSQLLHRVPVVSDDCCEEIRPVHSLNQSDFRSKGLKQD